MKILIVEDETLAYTRLRKMILQIKPDAEISEQVSSLEELDTWMGNYAAPDLAFFDIHLSDGTSFDMLENNKPSFPVIFTTAYAEYALQAFKAISIDYLLKPIKLVELERSFHTYQQTKALFAPADNRPTTVVYKKRFIVRFADTIKSIETSEIAYFVSKNKGTLAQTIGGRSYAIDSNLEVLEDTLDPDIFFRINRQYLVNIAAIADMKSYTKARVIITLQPQAEEQPIVSSERAAAFKKWLGGD